jgi:hypothetical protein
MGFVNRSDSLSISKVFGDTRSRALEALQQYRFKNQQRAAQSGTNVNVALPNALSHYSSSSVDTSCARPTNK